MQTYRVKRGNSEFGPYTSDEIDQYRKSGNIVDTDLILVPETGTWVTIKDFNPGQQKTVIQEPAHEHVQKPGKSSKSGSSIILIIGIAVITLIATVGILFFLIKGDIFDSKSETIQSYAGDIMYVNTLQGLQLYSTADTNSNSIGFVPYGDPVVVESSIQISANDEWWLVKWNGQTGWVRAIKRGIPYLQSVQPPSRY